MAEKIKLLGEPKNKLPDELERDRLGTGKDSLVDKIDRVERLPSVLKEYRALQMEHQLTGDTVINILEKYREDTKKAELLLEKNPNPTNEVAVTDSGEEWPVHFVIVPQGSNLQKGKDGIISMEGQDFISGKNYWQCEHETTLRAKKGRDSFVLSGMSFYINKDFLQTLNRFINSKLHTYFMISPVNVKPKIDRQQKILLMYITDLAANLYNTYFIKILEYQKN